MMASFQLHNDTVVSTIGEILVELVSLDTGTGFLERQNLRGPFASGAPAIFIDQIARLGLPFSMAGAFGDDDFGRLNVERLKRDFLITLDVSAATQIDINCVQQ